MSHLRLSADLMLNKWMHLFGTSQGARTAILTFLKGFHPWTFNLRFIFHRQILHNSHTCWKNFFCNSMLASGILEKQILIEPFESQTSGEILGMSTLLEANNLFCIDIFSFVYIWHVWLLQKLSMKQTTIMILITTQ